jgi:hypothetical protein
MHTVWWSKLKRRPAIERRRQRESRVREGHRKERERESTVREGKGRTAQARAVLGILVACHL